MPSPYQITFVSGLGDPSDPQLRSLFRKVQTRFAGARASRTHAGDEALDVPFWTRPGDERLDVVMAQDPESGGYRLCIPKPLVVGGVRVHEDKRALDLGEDDDRRRILLEFDDESAHFYFVLFPNAEITHQFAMFWRILFLIYYRQPLAVLEADE